MGKIKKLLKEAEKEVNKDTLKYIDDIESEFRKKFPKGWFEKSKSALGSSIFLRFGVQPEKDWNNKIRDNDPAFHIMFLDKIKLDQEIPDKFQVELTQGGSITIKPTEQNMAQGRAKVGWRKKTGSKEQIMKHITNYFAKLRKTLDASKKDMFPEHQKGTF